MVSMMKQNEPFAFWLIRKLFGSDEVNAGEVQPMNNKEFYFWMAIIVVGFLLVSFLIKTFIV